MTKSTNKDGRAAIYFDTKSHGGDNFRFKVSGISPGSNIPNDCMEDKAPGIFTLWRKIYLDYAFMEDRGNTYPEEDCYGTPYETVQKEFRGVHKIDNVAFDMVIGAFDDAFIEVVKSENPYQPDLPYWLYLRSDILHFNDLVVYGDYTDFRPDPPLDTILLIGVDHFDDECYDLTPPGWYTNGAGTAHWSINPQDAIYCFVGVGVTYDAVIGNGKIIITKEDKKGTPYSKIIGYTATHELGHCLMQSLAHEEFDYGVMNYDDRRSYFHSGHLIFLREGSTKFDQAIY